MSPTRLRSDDRLRLVLEFVRRYQEVNDYPPTLREIQYAVGYGSTSSVTWAIHRLAQQGNLSRRENHRQLWRILKPSARGEY